MGKSKEVLTAS